MKKQIVVTVDVEDFNWMSESELENRIESRFIIDNDSMFSEFGVDIKSVSVEVLTD